MSDNVTALYTSLAAVTGGPDPDVVEKLQQMLDRAGRGEIVAFAVAIVQPGNIVSHAYVCGGNFTHQLIAGSVYLQRYLYDELTNETDRDVGTPEGAA